MVPVPYEKKTASFLLKHLLRWTFYIFGRGGKYPWGDVTKLGEVSMRPPKPPLNQKKLVIMTVCKPGNRNCKHFLQPLEQVHQQDFQIPEVRPPKTRLKATPSLTFYHPVFPLISPGHQIKVCDSSLNCSGFHMAWGEHLGLKAGAQQQWLCLSAVWCRKDMIMLNMDNFSRFKTAVLIYSTFHTTRLLENRKTIQTLAFHFQKYMIWWKLTWKHKDNSLKFLLQWNSLNSADSK